METPDNAFKPSSLTLGTADERETLIDELNADCKHLRDLCWTMRSFDDKFTAQRTRFENGIANGEKPDVQPLLNAQIEFCRREMEIVTLNQSIVKRVDEYNFGNPMRDRLHLSFTEEGLPIRIDTRVKTPLWGI